MRAAFALREAFGRALAFVVACCVAVGCCVAAAVVAGTVVDTAAVDAGCLLPCEVAAPIAPMRMNAAKVPPTTVRTL